MPFTEEQKKLLDKSLDQSKVAQRRQGNANVDYIEGWHATAEANRIFGHDGWERVTVYCNEVCRYEREIGSNKTPGWKVGYEAKVRIVAGGIVREGTGHGSGIAVDLFDAIESAAKEAETDAAKRALSTFGWPFGLALYDKRREHVGDPQSEERLAYIAMAQTCIENGSNEPDIRAWWDEEKPNRRKYGLTKEDVDGLLASMKARFAELNNKQQKDAA